MWYVAETYSGSERTAVERLDALGVFAYLPTYELAFPHRRYSGVMVKRTVSLYPGYLFLQAAPEHARRDIDLSSVHRVPEVLGVLGDEDGVPYALHDDVIEEIRSFCNQPAPETEKQVRTWKVGDIAHLIYAGWMGAVEVLRVRRGTVEVRPRRGKVRNPITVPVYMLTQD